MGIACFPPTQFVSYRMSFRGHLPLRDFALTSCSADINAKSIRWNSSSILHGEGRSIIILFIKMQIYKGLLLIMVWGFKVHSCVHVHTYPCIYVFTSTWIHFIRGRQNAYKEEDQDSIIGGREGKWRLMLWASALLDEWTCSSGKLIKWESLASHLLSL